ncbi:Dual specificity protein phosphatase 23 [Echinococcus granulosus]|uniref:Dual specificity phosphatase n=1 Tax=Echinococcus granulosus TaxID=6210 RepID=A0A068WNK9_ECHGR|nr:Dual specificity protein phosphatase 23 [Echinococcus granulosus]CDS19216.1 dual specificity phosphatase [Echinococcus granulosus]
MQSVIGAVLLTTCRSACVLRMPVPPNGFSWVSDTVAGLAFPSSEENLDYLVNQAHILNLITLNDEKPRHLEKFPTLKHYFYPVEEFILGDLEMVREIVGIIASAETRGERSGVHCQFGQMRTGTILAAYLAYHDKVDGKEAIRRLCKMRPRSVFSFESEQVICEYAKSLRNS